MYEGTNQRSLFVDYVKGISISGIVLFHLVTYYMDFPSIIGEIAKFAGAGVHLFNICSGFGLALSYNKNPTGGRAFLFNRFAKIYIPYFIAITIYFLFSKYTFVGDNALLAYSSHVFLFKMFFPKYMSSFGGHFWYISTIFQFYLAFLLITKIKQVLKAKKFLCFSCVVSVLWMALVAFIGKGEERVFSGFFLQYLWEFSLGMYLADLYVEDKISQIRLVMSAKVVGLVSCVSLAVYGITGLRGGVFKNFNDIFAVLSIGGIYWLLYKIKPLANFFTNINKISYELYLMHILVFAVLFARFSGVISQFLIAIFALLVCVAVAFLHKMVSGKVICKFQKNKK